MPSISMQLKQRTALEKARATRLKRSEEADDELYELINEMPGSNAYKLAKAIGWSIGKVHGSIRRLEKDGLVKVDQGVSEGRVKLVVTPVPWQEFFTHEELEEMKQPAYYEEIKAILRKAHETP